MTSKSIWKNKHLRVTGKSYHGVRGTPNGLSPSWPTVPLIPTCSLLGPLLSTWPGLSGVKSQQQSGEPQLRPLPPPQVLLTLFILSGPLPGLGAGAGSPRGGPDEGCALLGEFPEVPTGTVSPTRPGGR